MRLDSSWHVNDEEALGDAPGPGVKFFDTFRTPTSPLPALSFPLLGLPGTGVDRPSSLPRFAGSVDPGLWFLPQQEGTEGIRLPFLNPAGLDPWFFYSPSQVTRRNFLNLEGPGASLTGTLGPERRWKVAPRPRPRLVGGRRGRVGG